MDLTRRPAEQGAGYPSGGLMSQKALDLRKSTQTIRRHKLLVSIVVALGILGGAAYAVLKPPMLESAALIVLPPQVTQQQNGATATIAGSDPFTATQVIVAGSNQVLLGALPDVHPPLSLSELRPRIHVASPAPEIISITAKGKTAAGAEATANAVAHSYVSLVDAPNSPVGSIRARLLESATNATGTAPVEWTVIWALVGGLAGALIGVIVALAIGRSDRRLRERDDIANSVGIPVLASVPVAHPSAATGWTGLLEDYKPASVHAWQLRAALQQLDVARSAFGHRPYDGNGASPYDDGLGSIYDRDGGSSSLLVLSLSSDPGALALGPQLAAFAASQNIPTVLVIGPQQDAAATATLRTACTTPPATAPMRRGMLRVTACDEGDIEPHRDTALVIVVAVVDSRAPEMPSTMRTNATVIGVSAGAATAEQLARAAVAASADGRDITGILVADPETSDQTTGRVPHLARPARSRLPSRLRGIVTEIKR
jgi:capsular polysaccharide biosynthesis protein